MHNFLRKIFFSQESVEDYSFVCFVFFLNLDWINSEVLVYLPVRLQKINYKNKPEAEPNTTTNSEFASMCLFVHISYS